MMDDLKEKSYFIGVNRVAFIWTLASLTLDCLSTANPYIQLITQRARN